MTKHLNAGKQEEVLVKFSMFTLNAISFKLPLFFYEPVASVFWRSVLKKFGHMYILIFPLSCDSEETQVPSALVLESEHSCGSLERAELLPLALTSARLTDVYRENTSAFKN